MNISLKTLLRTAPFPQEQRDKLLEIYDNLTEDQRFRLSEAAWTGLSMQYHAKLKYEFDKLNLEIAQGKRKYNPNDYEEVKARILHEFADKLKYSESQEQIEEVKKQLEKFKELKQP